MCQCHAERACLQQQAAQRYAQYAPELRQWAQLLVAEQASPPAMLLPPRGGRPSRQPSACRGVGRRRPPADPSPPSDIQVHAPTRRLRRFIAFASAHAAAGRCALAWCSARLCARAGHSGLTARGELRHPLLTRSASKCDMLLNNRDVPTSSRMATWIWRFRPTAAVHRHRFRPRGCSLHTALCHQSLSGQTCRALLRVRIRPATQVWPSRASRTLRFLRGLERLRVASAGGEPACLQRRRQRTKHCVGHMAAVVGSRRALPRACRVCSCSSWRCL